MNKLSPDAEMELCNLIERKLHGIPALNLSIGRALDEVSGLGITRGHSLANHILHGLMSEGLINVSNAELYFDSRQSLQRKQH